MNKNIDKTGTPHGNTTVDVTYISLDTDEGKDIRDQLEEIASRYSMHLHKLVALPNARPGRGFQPVEGYVMVLSNKAPVMSGIFDVNKIFKGRVITPLLDVSVDAVRVAMTSAGLDSGKLLDAITTKIPPERLHSIFAKARVQAFEANSAAADRYPNQFERLQPSESPCVVPTCSIIRKAFGFDLPQLVIEDHANLYSPDNVSVLEERLAAAVKRGESVDDFFTNSNMAKYHLSLLAWRGHMLELVRAAIIEAIMGPQAVDALGLRNLEFTRRKAHLHQITNTVYTANNGDTVYYSNTLLATVVEGALVPSGPFGIALWINTKAQSIGMLQQAGIESAVPYALPAKMPRALANEQVVVALESEHDHPVIRVPQTTTVPGVMQVTDSVGWMTTELEGRTTLGTATLIIPEVINKVRVAIPDLNRNYREGYESSKAWEALKACGISRDIEINVPYQPVVTVVLVPNTLDTFELWQVKIKMMLEQASTK